jgi:hypothetical protein
MKQYLSPEQTAKLIELGFEKPKSIVEGKLYSDIYFAYSIGELIEMLPRIVEYKGFYYGLKITTDTTYCWEVTYKPCSYEKGSTKLLPIYAAGSCLIDQLYETLLTLVEMKSEFTDIGGHIEYNGAEELCNVFKLKEEGVI